MNKFQRTLGGASKLKQSLNFPAFLSVLLGEETGHSGILWIVFKENLRDAYDTSAYAFAMPATLGRIVQAFLFM